MTNPPVLRETFQTPWSDHRDRIGQTFEITNTIDAPDKDHDAEVLPMYRIRFADGFEIEAWPEEIYAGASSWEPANGPASRTVPS